MLLLFSINTQASGLKASIGPEFVSTKTFQQMPYSVTQGNITEEGFITTENKTENSFQGRLFLGYDFNLWKGIGIEPTASINTDGDIRAEVLLNDKVNDTVTLKVGPSYTFESGNFINEPFGATAGVEVNVNDNVFLDFKANITQMKDRLSTMEERTVTNGSFFGGIGFRF